MCLILLLTLHYAGTLSFSDLVTVNAMQTFSTSCYSSEWQLIHMQSTKSSKIVILLVCQTWSTCSSSSYLVQSNNRFPHTLPFVRHRGCLRTCDHCSKVCLVPLKKRHLMTQDQRSRGTNFHKDPINAINALMH